MRHTIRHLLLCLLALAAPHLAVAERAQSPPVSPFASDAAFDQRITVHVSGMPLDELLPRIGRELGVVLRPATEDVGDLRVAMFIEALPGRRALEALTAMLNLTPEGGFGWRRMRRPPKSVVELYQSPAAHAQAAQRLRAQEEAALKGFPSRLRGMREDPELRKMWEDPQPVPSQRRATQLLASLSDDQIQRLVQDGALVLRPQEASPEQRGMIDRLASDLVSQVQARIQSRGSEIFPGEAQHYQNLDPSQFTILFEFQRQGAEFSVVERTNLGPGKGGSRYDIYPLPGSASAQREAKQAGTERTAAAPPAESPTGESRVIRLTPRSWMMAEVLSDLARRSKKPLVSDCYTQSWDRLASLTPLPLPRLLERIDQSYRVRWEEKEDILLMQSREAEALREREVPRRLVSRWVAQIERDRAVSLETLTEMVELSDDQVFSLKQFPDLQRLALRLDIEVWAHRQLLQLYALLSPAQRAQVRESGLRLSYEEMSPGQRKQLAYWAMLRQPELPEAQYTSAEISMRLTPDHEWRTTWTLGGRTISLTHYLSIDRDWDTGQARETTAPTRENLLGRPAPPLAVQDSDGRPRTLALPAGRTFLVYFREPWVVPYVGKDPGADLALLAGLLARRPELRDRIAVICPRERPADLREWLAQSPKALPAYADGAGSGSKAYGAEALPQAVLVGPDGRIRLVRSGYDEVMSTEWEEWLK